MDNWTQRDSSAVETYSKLASSIIRSTVWRQADHVRLMWITILALKDRDGEVMGSVGGMADAARITEEQAEDALRCLMAPDPKSRTKDLEGRRLVEIRGGWRVVTHEYYRAIADIDERRARDAERKRLERAASKDSPRTSGTVRDIRTSDAEADAVFRENSLSEGSSPDPDSDARESGAPPLKQAAPRGLTPGAQPVLLFKFPKGWKPAKDHQTLGRSLGLSDEAMLERAFHCRNKTYTHGFSDPDDQFNRELAWLRTELETANHKKALNERRANRSETPGNTRKPSDKRAAPVFGGGGTGRS